MKKYCFTYFQALSRAFICKMINLSFVIQKSSCGLPRGFQGHDIYIFGFAPVKDTTECG